MTAAPSRLEFGYAFDLAASWLSRPAAPLLAVVSTPEFVDHVGARAAGPVVFACEDRQTYEYAQRYLAGGAMPGAIASQCRALPAGEALDPTGLEAAAALWASPQLPTWEARLGAIRRLLPPGADLCILSGTAAGRLTRPLRQGRQAGEPAPLAGPLRRTLVAGGWEVRRSRALGGMVSLGWAAAGRLASMAGRDDLADRAERAHHLAVESQVGASYLLLLTRRGRA
ncbi:MAG TPA: hypothetical protein VHS99_27215 [Chloroflexota bacterium]|nr:hypothetical protein [Chloroflexota bacterium]